MISTQERDRVVTLTLNAPPVNVLDTALLTELSASLHRLAERDDLAAVLLAGAGRCFSAGASVEEHRAEHAEAMIDALVTSCSALQNLPVPAVALVHGACLGGALELISYCDFVVADPGATFGQPEIRLAFFPPLACVRQPRIAGIQNTAWLALTGEVVSAERAASMGLVQQVLARDEWSKVEATFAGLSVAALRLTKKALRLGAEASPATALARVKRLFLRDLYRTEDVGEGIASFSEKRKPAWRHR